MLHVNENNGQLQEKMPFLLYYRRPWKTDVKQKNTLCDCLIPAYLFIYYYFCSRHSQYSHGNSDYVVLTRSWVEMIWINH